MAEATAAPPRIRTATLLTHTRPEDTAAAVAAAREIAEQKGCAVLADATELEKHSGAGLGSSDSAAEAPDICLALGGDGTILAALRRYAGTGIPVFGVNFGTIGFLAAVDRDRLQEGLERAFSGDFEVMGLPGLIPKLEIESPVALNDITLTRRPHGRVAELSYSVGGEEVGHVRCDGLAAATPAGSTGYNLANQGPILAWGVEGYVVSFIAPHTLTARALVVAPTDVLTVGNVAGRDPVDVALDGEHVGELASGAELEIGFRDDSARLAQLPGANFYQRMREKFGRLA
jgi:NAD+ kinase